MQKVKGLAWAKKSAREIQDIIDELPEGRKKAIMKRYIELRDEIEDKDKKSSSEDT